MTPCPPPAGLGGERSSWRVRVLWEKFFAGEEGKGGLGFFESLGAAAKHMSGSASVPSEDWGTDTGPALGKAAQTNTILQPGEPKTHIGPDVRVPGRG